MALPLNTMPTFNLKVPSTGKTIKYRPFVVKEEKALLIAQQSEDVKVMVDTLKGVIKSCVVDDLDVDSLAVFDIEYIFTKIRGKSVGENIDLLFSCDEDHGEELNKKAVSKVTVDVGTIEVTRHKEHSNKIELFGNVGIVMKYPSIDSSSKLENEDGTSNVDNIFEVVMQSIDFIYQGEDIYYGKDQTREELSQFINNLTSEQFAKIQKFFETMPKLSTTVEYTCPVCGKHHKRVLEGLNNFFS
jgi:Zn finger protein HypA/HybF involved in hydrogenase expression